MSNIKEEINKVLKMVDGEEIDVGESSDGGADSICEGINEAICEYLRKESVDFSKELVQTVSKDLAEKTESSDKE